MAERTAKESKPDNKPKKLELVKSDDLAEGELDTVEESLRQHEKTDQQKEKKQ